MLHMWLGAGGRYARSSGKETDMKNMQTVESLKAEGLYFTAGAMTFEMGRDRYYGCHYGMRSTLEQHRAEFFRGYDAAAADAAAHG